MLNDNAELLIKEGSAYLFQANMANVNYAIRHKGLDFDFKTPDGANTFKNKQGKALDYALVYYEQSKVQTFLAEFRKNYGDPIYFSALSSISSSMYGPFIPSAVIDNAIEFGMEAFPKSSFHFDNYSHRAILGTRIIDYLYGK